MYLLHQTLAREISLLRHAQSAHLHDLCLAVRGGQAKLPGLGRLIIFSSKKEWFQSVVYVTLPLLKEGFIKTLTSEAVRAGREGKWGDSFFAGILETTD